MKLKLYKKFLFFPVILFLIVIVSIYSVWPIVQSPETRAVNANDDLLITWIINQNIQKIPGNIANFFQGNIFYPYKNTIAYADMFLPSAILAYIPVKLYKEPLITFNFNLIIGQILTISLAYFWFLEITKDKGASLVGAVTLGLSQIRMHYIAHLQMWNMQWFLAAGLMLFKFKKTEKIKFAYLAAFFAVVQFWESPLPVFFLLFMVLVLFFDEMKLLIRNMKHLLVAILVFGILIAPAAQAYYSVSNDFNYQRSIRDAAHFSNGPDNLLDHRFFSPGLYLLAFISLLILSEERLRFRKEFKFLMILAVVGFIMSLGPVLKWSDKTVKLDGLFLPLPYGIFYYLFPGFGALRTPSRWLWLTSFALSGLVSLALSTLKNKNKGLVLAGAFIIALVGGKKISDYYIVNQTKDYPEVYSWLMNRPENVVLELPIYVWSDGNNIEYLRMVYSLEHKKSLVNGASGFDPPPWEVLVHKIRKEFPDQEIEDKLISEGVELIVVHKKEFSQSEFSKIEVWGTNKKIWEDENEIVYKLSNLNGL